MFQDTVANSKDFHYKVTLTNFNSVIYEGYNVYDATNSAKKSGFECHVEMKTNDKTYTATYSPISGWRII